MVDHWMMVSQISVHEARDEWHLQDPYDAVERKCNLYNLMTGEIDDIYAFQTVTVTIDRKAKSMLFQAKTRWNSK